MSGGRPSGFLESGIAGTDGGGMSDSAGAGAALGTAGDTGSLGSSRGGGFGAGWGTGSLGNTSGGGLASDPFGCSGGLGSSSSPLGIFTSGNFSSGAAGGRGSVLGVPLTGDTAASLPPAGRIGSTAGGRVGGVLVLGSIPGAGPTPIPLEPPDGAGGGVG